MLDLISDVGGILGILTSFMSAFLFAWRYRAFDDYMISKLYQVTNESQSEQSQDSESKPPRDSYQQFVRYPLRDLKEFVRSILPRCMWCCGTSRVDKSFEIGQMMLGHETNIFQIIRSRRFVAEALQVLLSEEQRKVLLERSSYVVVDPDTPFDAEFDLLNSSRHTAQDKKD